MTEISLSFEEWIGLADRYLTASLRGKPVRHHDIKSANWGFQSQLADVRLMPSGGVVPRFLWHEGDLPGMRIGELAEGPELALQQDDAKRFADLATRFFYGDRTFIRTLRFGKRA